MPSVQVFSVLTEFKFDVAQAVSGSEALQKSTQKLSEAADQALVAVHGLGLGLVQALGIGGLAGIFERAVKTSDAFAASTLDMTAMISSNMNVLQGDVGSFNDRLAVGKGLMAGIAKEADRLNLDQGDMFSMFKALAPGMAQDHLAGNNFQNTTQLAGMGAGAASGLGMSQSQMASQISGILAGTVASGSLMNRLQATKAYKGVDASSLGDATAAERFKLLSAGLKEISMDMGDVAERANLLSFQMNKLKTLLMGDANGLGSIFKPIGDAVRPMVVGLLKDINGYVKNQGAQIAGSFAQLLKSFVSTPKEMLVNLLQLRQAQSDLGKAGKTLGFIGAAQGVGYVLSRLTGVALFATPIVGQLAMGISILSDIFKRCDDPISKFVGQMLGWLSIFGVIALVLAKFGVLLSTISFVVMEVLAPLAGLFIIFQAISRAVAKAHVEDALHLAEMLPKIMELFVRMKMALHNILLPIELAIDGLSDILKPIFKWSYWIEFLMGPMELLASGLEIVGDAFVTILAQLSGAFASFFQILLNFQEKGAFHMFDNLDTAFDEGFNDFIKKNKQKMDDGKNVSNNITNIGKVEIRNDFKEGMEPDRIAFTLKDQLLKAAQNPTQARNRSLQAGFGSK